MDKLTFLGTGDSMAVPRVYCRCNVCEEARTSGINRRLRSSVLVESHHEHFMIDCGPSWREQMEQQQRTDLDHLLITHAHYDHIGGLPEYADLCRWLRKKGNVYASPEVIEQLRTIYPWLENNVSYHPVDGHLNQWGWSITCWKVSHGHNGFSYAYRFDKPDFAWAYCPDSINLSAKEKRPLYELDLLILGTSFYKEEAPFHSRSLYDIVEALELLNEIRPAYTCFTHLSHGIDWREDYGLPPNCRLAKEGLSLLLAK
ncbi:MBL fold metallo-hydrolase [Paenibacillus senegalensis]|uniref:MBL fold metallo-hydrolase n=1 Tax=Paenibacillus senegalensis TaxID=1465766 RepID=UPI000288AF7D|nr:MBL fold metallo-hydrolase [Paenibacillus senegalensis]